MQALHPGSAWVCGPPSLGPHQGSLARIAVGVPRNLLNELVACAEACRALEREWGADQRGWPGVSPAMQRRHKSLQTRARALGCAMGAFGGVETMRGALDLLPKPLVEQRGWFELAFCGICGWAA